MTQSSLQINQGIPSLVPTGYPRSPRAVRGGLVRIDTVRRAVMDVVGFQYNPDSLTRSLQSRAMTGEPGDRLETTRLTGPPHETIKLEAEFDAADQLEHPDQEANAAVVEFGLTPILACLERLITPTVEELQRVDRLFDQGTFEVAPAPAPLLLFVWGAQRIVPVTITSISISEEAFDPYLNPIRAKATVDLKVLTSADLPLKDLGGSLYLTHRLLSEQQAQKITSTDTRPLGVERLP